MSSSQNRPVWNSKLGFLLAAIGSAIGLGNIWRFSYMVSKYGGGAFLIPYAVALICAGIPLMILEYALGHREKGASPLAFARISKKWEWLGWWMPITAFFGIMLYYSVIIGWCVNYLFYSIDLAWGDDPQTFFIEKYLQVTESPFQFGGIRLPIFFATAFVWVVCWIICFKEINHGIEKACIIFMPILLLLTLMLVGWTLRLEGASDAIYNFYLKPDWDKINFFANPEAKDVWIAAFGQIFFTLSLGFGIMITYASYLPEKTDIVGNALWISIINCAYSFMAGFAVFGIVGFMASSKGVPFNEVVKEGPQLAFVVFPEAIRQLPFGQNVFGVMFFLMLIIAGVSSGVSLIEAMSCAISDKFEWQRKKIVSVICLLGFLGSIIFTTRAGLLILDIVDHYLTHFCLVTGGLIECLLVGWILKALVIRKHVERTGGVRLSVVWDVCVKYVTPLILVVILANFLGSEFAERYGGYDLGALLTFGLGWIIATLAVAAVFSSRSWRPGRLKREHEPDDEHLLT